MWAAARRKMAANASIQRAFFIQRLRHGGCAPMTNHSEFNAVERKTPAEAAAAIQPRFRLAQVCPVWFFRSQQKQAGSQVVRGRYAR